MSSPSSSKRFDKGVSVHWLATGFLSEIVSLMNLGGNFKGSNLYEVNLPFSALEDLTDTKPGIFRRKGSNRMNSDRTLGTSYVDCLVGTSNVGPVECHLVYSRETPVKDVINALLTYCEDQKKNPEATYIWIDCLCLNLNLVADRIAAKKDTPKTEYERMVRYAARNPPIKKVLAVYAPPNHPLILQQTWPIFELYTAKKNGIPVEIIMPRSYKDKIVRSSKDNGLSNYFGDLKLDVKVQISTCNNAKEREDIMSLLKVYFPGDLDEGLNAWIIKFAQTQLVEFVLSNMTTDEGTSQEANDTLMDSICYQIGTILHQEKNYEMAYKLYQKCLVIREKKHQLDPSDDSKSEKVAQTYQNIGIVLQQLNDADSSLFHLKNALIIRKRLNGLYHIDTSDCYMNIGQAQLSLGNLDDAYDDYKTALMIEEKIHGLNHSRTATCYCGIGCVLDMMGRSDEALVYLQQSLMTREDILGKNDEDTAASHSAIATALTKKGEFEEALGHYKTAVEIYEDVSGMNSEKTATALNNLAMALCDEEKYVGALEYLKRARDIYNKTLGPNHPHSVMANESYNEVKKLCR